MLIAFGAFEIDEELFELRRHGELVPLQRKTFDLLAYLARSKGKVVTREKLIEDVWHDVVVAEPALNQAILMVRKALADDGAQPRIVETVRGRGYRFVAPVRERERAASAPDPSTATPGRTPLVGRADAVAAVDRAAAEAGAGQGRIVLVLGEPGIGKSRLVEEIETRARDARVVRGHAFSGEGAPPLWPWIQIGRRLGAIDGPVDPIDEVQTSEGRFRFSDRLVRRLLAEARDTTLLAVLEDAHWMEAESLELVRLLAPQLADARVLVVITARSGQIPSQLRGAFGAIARLSCTSKVELGGLVRADVASLVAAVSGRSPGPELVDRVLEKTGGNPALFMQIAHVLVDASGPVPATSAMLGTGMVKEAIAAQVAGLGEPATHVLTLAAVFGISFSSGPLALALEMPHEDVAVVLDRAVEQRILARSTGDETHRFTQPLVRDALYRRPLAGERVSSHASVARALIAFWGADARAVHAAAIAEHLCEAAPLGDVGTVVEFVLLGAEAALAANDRVRAARLFERGRRALSAASQTGAIGELRARLESAEQSLISH